MSYEQAPAQQPAAPAEPPEHPPAFSKPVARSRRVAVICVAILLAAGLFLGGFYLLLRGFRRTG